MWVRHLPAYLIYFLGVERQQTGADHQRASVQRALVVSVATSAGFIAVFLVVGTVSRLITRQLQVNAKYLSLVVGVGLIVLGVMMLRGWKPPLNTAAVEQAANASAPLSACLPSARRTPLPRSVCTIRFLVSASLTA